MHFRYFDPTRPDPPNLPKILTRPGPTRPAGRPDPCPPLQEGIPVYIPSQYQAKRTFYGVTKTSEWLLNLFNNESIAVLPTSPKIYTPTPLKQNKFLAMLLVPACSLGDFVSRVFLYVNISKKIRYTKSNELYLARSVKCFKTLILTDYLLVRDYICTAWPGV